TAERYDRIGDLAADLVDHDSLNRTDSLVVRSVNGRAFDLVAADERNRFAPVLDRRRCSHWGLLSVARTCRKNALARSVVPDDVSTRGSTARPTSTEPRSEGACDCNAIWAKSLGHFHACRLIGGCDNTGR